jgi:hypothetical protein
MTRLLFRKVNVLSIDVALGSVCAALFLGKYHNVEIAPISLVVLALTVWIIYTVDHLMDARRIAGEASSERHRFHQQYFGVLRIVVLSAAALTACFLFLLPLTLLYHGMILSVVVMVYILLHSWFPHIKEVAVALIYTMGVFLPTSHELLVSEFSFSLLISFALVALINLLLFSWFSVEEDRIDGISSLTTLVGTKVLRFVFPVLLVIQFLLAIEAAFNPAFLILYVMSLMLVSTFAFPDFFRKHDRYRMGDAVFFVAVIYLLL